MALIPAAKMAGGGGDPAQLGRLERVGKPIKLTAIGSTQLRFEGIDALELNPVPYRPPTSVRVQPPVSKDATPGYILSRAPEAHWRPVAFACQAVAVSAREKKRGLRTADRSHNGVNATSQADLEQNGVVFSKLLPEADRVPRPAAASVSGFLAWLADKKEQVFDLPSNNFTHFDNVLRV